VTATLTYLDTLVALDVQDDGVGFDTERNISEGEGGFGLKSLHEQAERLGGELSVESESGKGCTIAISVPDLTIPVEP
jgi:signal transduction histidine kinase